MKRDGKEEEIGKREKVKTAWVRSQGPLKKTGRERTQAPLKVEAIRLKDGEFEERKEEKWKKKKKKKRKKVSEEK